MKGSGMHGAIRGLRTLFDERAVGRLSDGQLLDWFLQRRDASAFETIVERYGPLVWGVCRRILRDHHDAEDAFQATFLVLARKAASIVPREKLGNWLYGVGFQTAMKARATRAKRRAREHSAREMAEPAAAPDEPADELRSRLDYEVSRLPQKYRLPIVLCELEGKTHRQASEQLGWPIGTVSGRLSRARALLASRLSRPGMPLTIGAVGALLAQDEARACVPADLIRSTARAATLLTAAKAATAGMVSDEVAALTEEVMKMMLLSKIKVVTAMVLIVSALAIGGTGLTYRAHATPSANPKQDSVKPTEPSNPGHAVEREILPSEERGQVAGGETESPSLLTENWHGSSQRKLDRGAYSFTASRTGDAALAYNTATRQVKAVRLHATKERPLWVTPVAVESASAQLVALGVKGERITRVAVFNLKSGKWTPLDLDQPVKGWVSPISFGPDTAAYEIGETLYMYNPKTDTWDRLALGAIADEKPDAGAARGR